MLCSANVFSAVAVICILLFACKTKQTTSTDADIPPEVTIAPVYADPDSSQKTRGSYADAFVKVIHQKNNAVCKTVLELVHENGEKQLLIPKDKLPDEFDRHGTEVWITYRQLLMPVPQECSGIMVEIKIIRKK